MPHRILIAIVATLGLAAAAPAQVGPPEPQVEMEIVSPADRLEVGERYTYRIRDANVGDATAATVKTVIRLPREVRYVRGGRFSRKRRRVTFRTRNLEPDDVKVFRLRVEVRRVGRVRMRGRTTWTALAD
jgi:hypothetical protein